MSTKSFVARAALAAAAATTTILITAGPASAEQTPQLDTVTCSAGDGLLATNCAASGSAAGSGHMLGSMLGRLLFHNDDN
ncbi:hypothetical protein AB0N05_19235 [Nocardia sp. NPDC051030]|uniref:hypothetical protein n=1 Tax=Nocardia sp. NPDC051030 TaxID=3155162 RepID=UPI003419C357